MKIQLGDCYEEVCGNLEVDLFVFGSYSLHLPRLQNIGTGDTDIKFIHKIYQGNNEFIITNVISDINAIIFLMWLRK